MSQTPEKRFLYTFPPPKRPYAYQHSSIRDLATAYDICSIVQICREKSIPVTEETYSHLQVVVKNTIEAWVPQHLSGENYVDGNIGDSGFMLATLAKCSQVYPNCLPQKWDDLVQKITETITSRQRQNGSIALYYDTANQNSELSGEAFYLPEALIGLCYTLHYGNTPYVQSSQEKLYQCLSKAFGYMSSPKIRDYHTKDKEMVVFYTNWQFQFCWHWGSYLIEKRSGESMAIVTDHAQSVLSALQQTKFARTQFNEESVVVEVACFLEGIAHIKKLFEKIGIDRHDDWWLNQQILRSLEFLKQVQDNAPIEWEGGLAHYKSAKEGRIDVTGHFGVALTMVV